ncbi:MAG TPA: bifunctional methionine sulfoxide reductase B/A protein [Candidatus Desulfaltia sp.]|nr:bifunctional methionine sulfoxide reductase B/A protein [Candidatus Desulfaltia sp.]
MNRSRILTAVVFVLLAGVWGFRPPAARAAGAKNGQPHFLQQEKEMLKKIEKSEKEWKALLTPEKYRVLRQSGTERPFTGKYNDYYEDGIYVCGACGTPLFAAETKYDHGTGWPSFTAPVGESHLEYREDRSHGMVQTEVRCAVCGSHLGHVFDDGPAPTKKHFCINSIALNFKPASATEEKKKLQTETTTFAAGCFWGVEDKFRKVRGVVSTRVGYTGGQTKNPTYRQVCSDSTGHAESIEIVFDPAVVSYNELLDQFFELHDPTQVNRQGPDVGTQYRSAVFYHDEVQKEAAQKTIERLNRSGKFDRPIATQVLPATEFYEAEDYHQQYYQKLHRGK